MTLPPRDELPDYYEFTKLPIAIDTIEDKINEGAYSTITEIESDFKRMVQNAKDYNSSHSEIFDDAERIRKLVYNYMKQHNPAYNDDPSYTSFPTPIPKAAEKRVNGNADGHVANGRATETPARQRKSTAPASVEPPEKKTPAVADEAGGEHESGVNFTKMSFQDAQQAIIDSLLKHTDEEYVDDLLCQIRKQTNILEGDWRSTHHLQCCLHGSWKTTTNSSNTLSL